MADLIAEKCRKCPFAHTTKVIYDDSLGMERNLAGWYMNSRQRGEPKNPEMLETLRVVQGDRKRAEALLAESALKCSGYVPLRPLNCLIAKRLDEWGSQ